MSTSAAVRGPARVAAVSASATVGNSARVAAPAVSSGCAWPTAITDGSALASDTDAAYWGTTMVSSPGAELTFQGSFPTARYMSYTMYDPNGNSLPAPSHIYDAQLTPSSGVNRFQTGETGPGSYVVDVVAGAAPATPAPNTIYTGTTNGETVTIVYRIYDSNVAGDPTGGVGLPSETTSLNGVTQATYAGCAGSTSGTSAAAHATRALTAELAGAPAVHDTARDAETRGRHADVLSGDPAIPLWAVPNPTLSNTTVRNEDAAVVGADLYPANDEVVVVRMKAPTFPNTDIGQPPWQAGQQVRYWSMCTYQTPSNNPAGCIDDAHAVTSGGYVTFVISTNLNRPTNATTANGINWLSIGAGPGEWDASAAYRQVLASPTFLQSISGVRIPSLPILRMGAYYPLSAYCTVTEFEQAGTTGCLHSGGV